MMNVYMIDLLQVHTVYDLHEHMKSVFSLPDHYGRNMDALWDLLHCAFDELTIIEVKGITQVPNDLRETIEHLQGVLSDLRAEDGVTISYL